MSRENLLDLLGGLMRGGVPDSGEDYITQLEDNIHLGDLTSANLTFFMRNVQISLCALKNERISIRRVCLKLSDLRR